MFGRTETNIINQSPNTHQIAHTVAKPETTLRNQLCTQIESRGIKMNKYKVTSNCFLKKVKTLL